MTSTGTPASLFLLAEAMRHHLKNDDQTCPEVTSILNLCLYRDDLMSVADATNKPQTFCG